MSERTDLLTPADAAALPRLLRLDGRPIPQQVIDEYNIRIRMFHSAGHSGPIGTVALIDMIRYLGINPIPEQKSSRELVPQFVDLPEGAAIEVRRNATWNPARLVRVAQFGIIVARVEGDNRVTEWRKDQVRLPEDEENLARVQETETEPDPPKKSIGQKPEQGGAKNQGSKTTKKKAKTATTV